MHTEEIRKQFATRPFKPLEIHLDNGEIYHITRQEAIVTEKVFVALDKNGETVYIAPEAISAIKFS